MTLYDLSLALSNLAHDPRVDGNTPVVLAYETDTPDGEVIGENNAPIVCLYVESSPRRIVLAAVKHEPALVR